MKKYMVVGFTNKESFDPSAEPTDVERKAIFEKWMAWKNDMGELLVSMGSPLINGSKIDGSGLLEGTVSDMAGYMIIKAEHPQHAYELLAKSPLFDKGHGQRYELFECIM